MNIQRGLERVSAVWWSLLSLLGFGALIGGIVGALSGGNDSGSLAISGLVGVAAAYAAHKVTCWVLAGFFSPRP